MNKATKLLIYNISGYSMAVIGIFMLFLSESMMISVIGAIVAFIGCILIGGLPKIKDIKRMLKFNISFLVVGIIALGFYYRLWGIQWVLRDMVSWFFGLFFVAALLGGVIQGLIKD